MLTEITSFEMFSHMGLNPQFGASRFVSSININILCTPPPPLSGSKDHFVKSMLKLTTLSALDQFFCCTSRCGMIIKQFFSCLWISFCNNAGPGQTLVWFYWVLFGYQMGLGRSFHFWNEGGHSSHGNFESFSLDKLLFLCRIPQV